MLNNKLLLTTCLSMAIAGAAQASQVHIDTSFHPLQVGTDNQGWWSNVEINNNPTNDNYYTGAGFNGDKDIFRSFFSFDLSGLNGTVTSATFEVTRYYNQNASVTLGFFDVSTPALELITTRLKRQDASIFEDLGSGLSYGVFNVQASGLYDVLTFGLNANALSDINAKLGSGYFSIGAAVLGPGFIFSGSSWEPGSGGQGYTQRLVLEISPIPEPSMLPLLGFGLAVVVACRKLNRTQRGQGQQ